MRELFSRPVTVFHGRQLPEPATLVGWAALIDRYQLEVPVPPRLAAISQRHRRSSTDHWLILTPRHTPEDTLEGHVEFGLKWEGVNLSVLAALFAKISDAEVARVVAAKPTAPNQ